jgi:hypothetical protein
MAPPREPVATFSPLECGSHSGPTDFHLYWFGFADGVDCLYDADEVATGESLEIGWAADGYPIIFRRCLFG